MLQSGQFIDDLGHADVLAFRARQPTASLYGLLEPGYAMHHGRPRRKLMGLKFLDDILRNAPILQKDDPLFPLWVSMGVIRIFLYGSFGSNSKELVDQWCRENIETNASRIPYFRANYRDGYCPQQAFRLIELAELLFNLCPVPGIGRIFRRIVMDPQAVEPTIMELDCFRQLVMAGLPFRIVSLEKGNGNREPECQVRLPDGTIIHCEVKAKSPAGKCSESNIYSKLSDGRKQLPKDATGVLFFTMSADHFTNYQTELRAAIDRLFRGSNRVAEVLVFARKFIGAQDEAAALTSVRSYLNDRSPHCDALGKGLLSAIPYEEGVVANTLLYPAANWLHFSRLNRDALREIVRLELEHHRTTTSASEASSVTRPAQARDGLSP